MKNQQMKLEIISTGCRDVLRRRKIYINPIKEKFM
jgi:hypothetical protein